MEKTSQIVMLPEKLTRGWVESNSTALLSSSAISLTLDFSKTIFIDSTGISLIMLLDKTRRRCGKKLILLNISQQILGTLNMWSSADTAVANAGVKESFLERVANFTLKAGAAVVSALLMLSEMVYWSSIGLLKKRNIKKGALGEQMYQLGFRALGIVTLLSFLIGVVLALQAAMQLRIFGAGVFLAPMIGITMVRELGPMLTAIILAGRSGSATTAEIATMKINEELDALQTMGINTIQFVVTPKFWAITLTMPLLSICSVIAGIIGGYLISLFYLNIASSLFWSQLIQYLFLKDVIAGFIKSVIFSWLIIWIGVFYGFKVEGGADAVGRETTASVVTGIFIIIVADALFSFIL